MSTRIEEEKNKYNKVYTDLVFASDDLKQMLDEDELNKRNKEIAKKHKNGKTIEELADEYYLTGYSIRRIIKKVDL